MCVCVCVCVGGGGGREGGGIYHTLLLSTPLILSSQDLTI